MPSLLWTVALLVDAGVIAECSKAEPTPPPPPTAQACEIFEEVAETEHAGDGWFKFTFEGSYSPGASAFVPPIAPPSLVHEMQPGPGPHPRGFQFRGVAPPPHPQLHPHSHAPEGFPPPLTAFAPPPCPLPPGPPEVMGFPHQALIYANDRHPIHPFALPHPAEFIRQWAPKDCSVGVNCEAGVIGTVTLGQPNGQYVDPCPSFSSPVAKSCEPHVANQRCSNPGGPAGMTTILVPNTTVSPTPTAGQFIVLAPSYGAQEATVLRIVHGEAAHQTKDKCVCECKAKCCKEGQNCNPCECKCDGKCCDGQKAAAGETVVLAFEADWCGPCQRMKPVVRKLQREGYTIRTINIDSEQGTAKHHDVHSLPTYIRMQNGKEVGRVVGSVSEQHLKALACKTQTECQAACPSKGVCTVSTINTTATTCEFPGASKVERFVRVTYPVANSAGQAMQTLLETQCPDVAGCVVEGDTLVVTAPEHAQQAIAQFISTVVKPAANGQQACTNSRPVARTTGPAKCVAEEAGAKCNSAVQPASHVAPAPYPQCDGAAKTPTKSGCTIRAADGKVEIELKSPDGKTSRTIHLQCDKEGVVVSERSGNGSKQHTVRLKKCEVQLGPCALDFDFATPVPTAKELFNFYLGVTR